VPGRVYLSNIAPGWPIERQEELLDEALPGWRELVVLRDVMTVRQRRARVPKTLVGRSQALRPSTRAVPTPLHVAALPVMGWGSDDFRSVLAALAGGNCMLISHETGTTIQPGAAEADRERAVQEFVTRRRKASKEVSRIKGAQVSADRRRARTKAGAERIRDRWGNRAEWKTKDLLREAGAPGRPLSYNAVVGHLGGREAAELEWLAPQKQ